MAEEAATPPADAVPSEPAAYPGPEVTSTAEATETATPLAESGTPELTPLVQAARVRGEGWSPDGRYLLYRTYSADEATSNEDTAGELHVHDTEAQGAQCTEAADLNMQRPHLWLDEQELFYVTVTDEVAAWPVCSDMSASWTETFPEIPLAILAASPDRNQFLFLGESGYWLFDRRQMQAERVESLNDAGGDFSVTEKISAAWSPDGSKVAVYPQDGLVIVVESATGSAIQQVEVPSSQGGPGAPEPLAWLNEKELLVLNTERGSLLVPMDGEAQFVEERFFDMDAIPEAAFGMQYQTWAVVDEATGSYHIVHTTRGDGSGPPGSITSYPQVYHSETGEVEEIQLQSDNGISLHPHALSENGHLLLLDLMVAIGGSYQTEKWIRPVDPAGAELQLIAIPESGKLYLSPDGSWIATEHEAGITLIDAATGSKAAEWALPGARVRSWSPDSQWIVVEVQGTEESSLYLLPVS